jgi:hypothetical protein
MAIFHASATPGAAERFAINPPARAGEDQHQRGHDEQRDANRQHDGREARAHGRLSSTSCTIHHIDDGRHGARLLHTAPATPNQQRCDRLRSHHLVFDQRNYFTVRWHQQSRHVVGKVLKETDSQRERREQAERAQEKSS